MLGSSLLVFPAVRTGANIHRASRPYAALLCRETTRFRENCSRARPVCIPGPARLPPQPHNSQGHTTAAGAFAFYSSEQLCSESSNIEEWLAIQALDGSP
jgi:hypothetical protein